MRRFSSLSLCAALALTGTASADIPPPVPEDPLGEACQPFIGIWHRVEPRHTRSAKTWWVVAIDSQHVTVLNYDNQENINIHAEAISFQLECTKNADGTTLLALTNDAEMSTALTATLVDETTFTTPEETSYLSAGPPDPNWKPETITITWKRIAR